MNKSISRYIHRRCDSFFFGALLFALIDTIAKIHGADFFFLRAKKSRKGAATREVVVSRTGLDQFFEEDSTGPPGKKRCLRQRD